jgi:single-stranded DNA-binding protein
MKTIIIGRLADNPTISEKDGYPVARFTIRNNTIVDGKEAEQFHKVVVFDNPAKAAEKYLKQGCLCCIEGIQKGDIIGAKKVVFLSSRQTEKEEDA